MHTIELTNNKHTRKDFVRMRSVLACASKDSTRHVITKVLVETHEDGITVIATDGRRMRSDGFSLEAEAGLYDIKVNSAKSVFLTQCQEELVFPTYRQVIPNSTDEIAYALEGRGKQFVLWATAALGCWIDPTLVELGEDEAVTLYINKDDPKLAPVLVQNETTTLVVMPMKLDHRWEQEIDAILTERVMKAMQEQEAKALAA